MAVLRSSGPMTITFRSRTLPNAPDPDAALVGDFAVDIPAMCDEHYTSDDPIIAAGTLAYRGLDGDPKKYEPPYRE